MNIETIKNFHPANVLFKTVSQAGRTLQQIIYKLDGTSIQLWAGSNSKVHEEKFNLAWQTICQQQASIDLLNTRIDTLESSSKNAPLYDGAYEEQN